jgi:hypothetical protein
MSERPIDPFVSIYPLQLSPRRARFEARRARKLRLRLPPGHPYDGLPSWAPYWVAAIIARRKAKRSKVQ